MTNAAPLPYPSGWFCVGLARDVPPGRVRTARLMGEDVVLYRTRRGTLRAVGPHCPHLGAHFGAGGTVRGEDLVCPFHGFAFGPDGSCTGAPDGTRLRAGLAHHHLAERDGVLYVWRGIADEPPTWELPPPVGAVPLAWWRGEVLSHPQEVMENGVDFRHVSVLHGLDTRETAPPEVAGPLFTIHQRTTTRFPGLGAVGLDQPVALAGLGTMRLVAELPELGGRLRVWVLATPVAPWRTLVRFAVACSASAGVPGVLGAAADRAASWVALRAAVRIIKQDRPVLAHKRYLAQPRLVPGERSIGLFRRWARQFYGEEACRAEPRADGAPAD
ncbi:Rieske 2Fe-2S domain-containing protein [Streptomyces sp. SP17BM10]|uniref:aromatic ring-hydroxylating oxygenase subunit alpha n=1 Tax=Streptomyces sp. SP17BM10 TaxID=3002530 RepID=UPI002E768218|nr:Rieske 2Fe-2S domain-containing protein [Streptomyces sp. SP17BM10]MEE1785353.1 Rieske 2Fe-2S domain-containing protein [Streptomyces sp. SP17BM10]